MKDIILTINAGSSSVKFSVFEIAEGQLRPMALGLIDGIGAKATFTAKKVTGEKTEFVLDQSHHAVDHKMALTAVLDWMEKEESGANVVGVGHRVVHGGCLFRASAYRRRELPYSSHLRAFGAPAPAL